MSAVKQVRDQVEKTFSDVVNNESHEEGRVARSIEQQTAKLPSDLFLWSALGSMAIAATLHISGRKATSNFVGQWAPCFLLLGIYNKIVKVSGSDQTSR